MKPAPMEKLSDSRDLCELTRGVLDLCEPFGPVHSFQLTHNRGTSRVACIIELELPRHHLALARAIGARVLSGAVSMEIPVSRNFDAAGRVSVPRRPAFEARLAG